jgi:RHS repeat-associated protein
MTASPRTTTSDNDYDPDSGDDNDVDPDSDDDQDDHGICEERVASSVEMQTQVLKHAIPIARTPFTLHYQSNRVPGGQQAAYTMPIGLIGPAVPASLERIDLKVTVAGQQYEQSFVPAANQVVNYAWDGRDGYGRVVQGRQRATVEIGYVYPVFYPPPSSAQFSFTAFAQNPAVTVIPDFARNTATLSRRWTRRIGGWDSRAHGLGGWAFDVHHVYDPNGGVLYRGDGGRQAPGAISNVISRVAGGGTPSPAPGLQARNVRFLGNLRSTAPAADGSIYLAWDQGRIWRIDPDGVLRNFVGDHHPNLGAGGDGGPATAAQLQNNLYLATAPDGSVFISDAGNFKIRRVGTDGVIHRVAGNGVNGSIGGGGDALSLSFSPGPLSVASDGTVYFAVSPLSASNDKNRVFRLTTGGRVEPVAGSGSPSLGGEGGPALAAGLGLVTAVHAARDGSIYVAADSGSLVHRVTASGMIHRIAGTGLFTGPLGENGPALDSRLGGVKSIDSDEQGTLYVTSTLWARVLTIGKNGILRVLAGSGSAAFPPGDDGPAAVANVNPIAVAVLPSRGLALVDAVGATDTLRVVRGPAFSYSGAAFRIPSRDGLEVYDFDADGRHLTTRHPLTGKELLSFAYDADGRLTSITDGDLRTTTIEHDGAGDPIGIHAPSGAQTTLAVDGEGFLETITNPEGEVHTFACTADGLMLQHEEPRGHVAAYEFDSQGALMRVERTDTGSYQALVPAPLPGGEAGRSIGRTSAQGRTWSYDVAPQVDGRERWTVTRPDGIAAETTFGFDGMNVTTRADGSVTTTRLGGDPRWGMRAPLLLERVWGTGDAALSTTRTLTETRSRAVTLDSTDPLSLLTQIDTAVVNGKPFTTTFAKGNPHTITRTTPAGRTWVTEIDDQGRPTRYVGPGVAPTVLAYDDGVANPLHKGMLRSVTQAARQVDLSYDTYGELSSVSTMIDATSSTTVGFAYDAAGRLIDKTLADDHHLRLRYDDAGNLETVAQPGSADVFVSDDVHVLDHEARGLLSSYTAPDIGLANHSTSYEHSADGDLELITRPDDLTIDRVYDFYAPTGNLDRVVTDEGIVEYVHFPSTSSTAPGKLEAVVNHIDNVTVTFGYEGSLLTQTSWSGAIVGTYARAYDNDLRVASETVAANTAVFTYADPDGLLTQAGALAIAREPASGRIGPLTIGTLTEAIAYNTYGEPDGHTVSDGSATLYQINLVRDLLGRIEYKTETLGGPVPGAIAHRYRYDDAGRLWQVYQGAAPCDVGPCSLIATYGYDANGNRTTVTTSTGTATADYDAQDRLEGIDSPATSYTYTPAGELESRTDATGTTYFEYDVFGNLKRVTPPIPGAVITYLVDGQNRRVAKRVGGTMTQGFLYGDGPGPIAELAGDGTTVVARFVYATRYHVPDYMVKLVGPDAGTYRFITDQLGSVRMVVNVATGAVVQQIRYDAWGNPTLEHGTWSFQSFAFAGGLHDPATGLIRFGARDYDPALGRWTAKDPIRFAGGDSNLYAYVFSDPVNYIDPEGLLSGGEAGGGGIGVAGALVTVGVVVGIYVIWDWVEHRERDWTDGGDVQILPWPTEKCTPDDDVCGEGDEELPQICPLEEETQDWCIYRCGDGTTVQTRRHGHPVPGVYPENDVCPRRIGYH